MRTNEERLRRIGRRTAQLRRARQRRRQRALDAVCVGACLLLVSSSTSTFLADTFLLFITLSLRTG